MPFDAARSSAFPPPIPPICADMCGLTALIAAGTVQAADIRATLGKTEGNGCVNEFTRAYAVSAFQNMLAGPLGCTPAEVGHRIALVMFGGTEGGLSPHFLVFAVSAADAEPGFSLAIGTGVTRPFRPEEPGRMAQIEATAEAVAAAIAQAAMTRPEDVHYVQVKCPLMTGDDLADAAARDPTVAISRVGTRFHRRTAQL